MRKDISDSKRLKKIHQILEMLEDIEEPTALTIIGECLRINYGAFSNRIFEPISFHDEIMKGVQKLCDVQDLHHDIRHRDED